MQTFAAQAANHDRTIGIGICLAAVLTVLTMAHHPTGMHGSAGGGDFVHGAMMVLLAFIAFGLLHFSLRRGLDRPWVLAAVVAYTISLGAHLGAATLNGFVAPALAARGTDAAGHDVFRLVWVANQALARIGVYATGAAFLCWSLDLLRGGQIQHRLTAMFGMLAGALPAAAIYAGWLQMNVRGAIAIYAAHAAWVALVGFLLIRRAA